MQNIQDIDRKAVGNNRQAGKIGLLILNEIGWVRIVGRLGVSTIYAIAQDNTKRPSTIDDYITKSLEDIYNVPEDLSDVEPEDDPPLRSKEDKDSRDREQL